MSLETQSVESVLDLSTAMENLDGDVELLQEVLEIFIEMGPEQLDSLDSAIQAGVIPDVDNLAHSLKGSASNFCAVQFVQTAFQLEHLAKGGSLAGAPELMQQLRDDFKNLSEIQTVIDWEHVIGSWTG